MIIAGDPAPPVPPDPAEDRAARVALTWLAEPGNRTVWSMVQQIGAPAALELVLRGEVTDPGLRASVLSRNEDGEAQRLAEVALSQAERLGARIVVPSDPEWPMRVNALATLEVRAPGRVNRDVRPPLCVWVRGGWELSEALDRSVAVVGARAATGYGAHATTEIAYGLAEQGWTVVSGGAFGIDAAAHRAALAAGGRTIAVLASGVDNPYPSGNASMFERIAETGLLISEWPPGTEPLRHRFLIRNRVIAAATEGTVMVEAAARSGAAQTMGRVLELRRKAMVVPGPITSAMSVGCHEVLRANPMTARLVTCLSHVLEEVGKIGEHYAERMRGPEHPRDGLDEESALVLEAMPRRGTTDTDRLAAKAGLGLRTVLRRLSLLETMGLIIRRDDGVALTPASTRGPARAAGQPGVAPSATAARHTPGTGGSSND
ncbi:DNA-processing protein DprA [Actinoplanes sp. NPDC051633]|uniref:DNA-processing protein DprA n=1 Tax=Actinoplanes sp. NPDC051633 TaxID=3155670 RepID=UPI0034168A56